MGAGLLSSTGDTAGAGELAGDGEGEAAAGASSAAANALAESASRTIEQVMARRIAFLRLPSWRDMAAPTRLAPAARRPRGRRPEQEGARARRRRLPAPL